MLSVLEDIKLPFCQWLRQLGLEDGGSAIANRLPAYFREALEKEWCQHPQTYDIILQRFNTPFSQANEQGRAWMRYSSWLQKQIEEPIFQEAFSLRQIYIWPRAYYCRKLKPKDEPHRSQPSGIDPVPQPICELALKPIGRMVPKTPFPTQGRNHLKKRVPVAPIQPSSR